MFNIFAKKPTPEEMVRKWTSSIRTQQRGLDRQLQSIKMDEKKAERTIKQLARKGDTTSCKILAKELVRSRKQRDRIATNKAQLNSITMELGYQASKLKVVGSLQKSTQVMRSVNRLMSVPQLQRSLMEMSKEMMKAGVIDEMTEDMMDGLEDEDLEEEAEEEVERVLAEVTNGVLGGIASVPKSSNVVAARVEEEEEEEEPDLEDMQRRLSALRS
ncbi:Vacuolar protein-sorting-associated protein 24 [Coemansia erecta]|nr:Vacuolar protein-sorting-associated protein 24 [Coemansia sp. RSA 2618]KAJ2825034.1 Vacuolar protein-sorting-associated protein 24 [Coemansia erecta]